MAAEIKRCMKDCCKRERLGIIVLLLHVKVFYLPRLWKHHGRKGLTEPSQTPTTTDSVALGKPLNLPEPQLPIYK